MAPPAPRPSCDNAAATLVWMASADSAPLDRATGRVLVIEDDPHICELVLLHLRLEGLATASAVTSMGFAMDAKVGIIFCNSSLVESERSVNSRPKSFPTSAIRIPAAPEIETTCTRLPRGLRGA